MTEEKKVAARWVGWLFGHLPGPDGDQKKNSCAENFSLALTRREAEILLCALRNPNGCCASEDWDVVTKITVDLQNFCLVK